MGPLFICCNFCESVLQRRPHGCQGGNRAFRFCHRLQRHCVRCGRCFSLTIQTKGPDRSRGQVKSDICVEPPARPKKHILPVISLKRPFCGYVLRRTLSRSRGTPHLRVIIHRSPLPWNVGNRTNKVRRAFPSTCFTPATLHRSQENRVHLMWKCVRIMSPIMHRTDHANRDADRRGFLG